eukprot:tig00000369_g24607.t3
MRQTTVLLMRQIYQHSAAPPTRLPRRRAAGVESGSDPVAASASAPSRLPGGLEGDALVQGAAGVESGSDPVAASASAPSRLPGGLEGDALVQGAAGVETGWFPMRQATVPLLRRICQHSAAPPTRLPCRRLRLLGCLAVLRATPWGRRPWRREWVAASASAPSRLPGGLEGDALTDPFVLQLAPDAADDRAAAAANLPTLGSATDPVAVSASAPSRLPGGFEGDAVGQAAVGVESGSDPVAASASAPSRLPGGLEGDALVQGAAGVETGWLPMRLQRERGTLPLQEGQGPCLREILSCRHSSWNARWVLRKILRGRSMRL